MRDEIYQAITCVKKDKCLDEDVLTIKVTKKGQWNVFNDSTVFKKIYVPEHWDNVLMLWHCNKRENGKNYRLTCLISENYKMFTKMFSVVKNVQ